LSIVKIAFLRSIMIVASRVRQNFPTGNDILFVAAFLKAKTTPSGRSVTRASSRRCSTASLAIGMIALASAGVERHAQCPVIPQDLTGRRTRVRVLFPGTPRPLVPTPRGQLRPDRWGRERPPSERVRGRLPGVAEGVAHAPSSVSTIVRAASAAARNAAAFSMTARAHPLAGQRVAVSVSSARRCRQHRRSAVQFSGLKGDNSYPTRCPPFCLPCPSARAAIN
jgi:hypothetical protein